MVFVGKVIRVEKEDEQDDITPEDLAELMTEELNPYVNSGEKAATVMKESE